MNEIEYNTKQAVALADTGMTAMMTWSPIGSAFLIFVGMVDFAILAVKKVRPKHN